MKLVIPSIDALAPADGSLLRLAEFLGVACEPLALPGPGTDRMEFLRTTQIGHDSCCVINPEVMKTWLKGDVGSELALILADRFRYRLVHAPRADEFHAKLVAALSGGVLQAVKLPQHTRASYEVALGTSAICEAFAGLTFGPIDRSNDRVFRVGDGPGLHKLISIGDDVFMATVKRGDSETVFMGNGDIADLATKVRDANPIEYFSRFVAPAMAIRHI